MSFILDALKKLEQKRQQGAVPDLMTIHVPERQKHGKRALWPYLVLGALVLNAGILVAVFRPWKSDDNKPAAQASAGLPQKTSPGPVQQFVKKNGPSGSPHIKKNEAVTIKKPIVPKVSSGPLNNTVDIKNVAPAAKHEKPPASAEVTIKGPDQIEEAHDENKQSPDESSTAVISMNPSQHEMETLRNKIKEDTSRSGGARPGKNKPLKNVQANSDERVPDFSQLPEETRKVIPNITISAHIYSNNPRSRIVNINGSTIKEGDEVMKGLKVSEITMSGVILDYQGQRFQVRAF